MMQRILRAAPSAQDHKIVRMGDEASAEALLKTELLPPQHKPAHEGTEPGGEGARPQRPAAVPRVREEGASGGFGEEARAGCAADGGEPPSLRGVSLVIHFGASF
jgi:hypothetical protein